MANKINWALSLEMFDMMKEDIKPHYQIASKLGWKFWVVNSVRGYCIYAKKEITIPTWAIERGIDYYNYYLAHELAHIFVQDEAHGQKFMAEFKRICPPDLQHFELEYKPRNAAIAGIANKLIF